MSMQIYLMGDLTKGRTRSDRELQQVRTAEDQRRLRRADRRTHRRRPAA